MMKLKKGDQVIILSGKDKGKTGKIIQVLPRSRQVIVEGVNIVKRAYKPSNRHPQGGWKEEPRPLPAAKVGIAHPDNPQRPARIGYQLNSKGHKVRIFKPLLKAKGK